MKVLKLNVQFDGYYGGSVNETMLLPPEVDGILFEKLEVGKYEEAIYLGEIAGKHSECYGDLFIESIDLDELSIKKATELIEGSDIGDFEGFFEINIDDFEETEDYSEEKVEELANKYNLKNDWLLLDRIYHRFINELKEKYVKKFATVTILEDDLDRVKELLKKNEIDIF